MARILIIDDEAGVRATLSLALQASGHETLEAANGRLGLELFARERVDLVITDILMPEKEGIETIIELRQRRPDLKIVAISGGGRSQNKDYLVNATHLGADATLRKPFSMAKLAQVIDACLGGKPGT
jgi:DNA-binding response OmpR family regulator